MTSFNVAPIHLYNEVPSLSVPLLNNELWCVLGSDYCRSKVVLKLDALLWKIRTYWSENCKVKIQNIFEGRERGGSVVECRTPEREVRGSRPTAAVLCPWARHFTPRKYWLITQEAMALSRHDWKIVDWDVKPQHNQNIWGHDKLKKKNFFLPSDVRQFLIND